LGMYTPNFFPERAGADYEPSRYLRLLQAHRDKFTVFSGMSHRYPAGHFAESALFTGVHPDNVRPTDLRNSISLDQEVASHVGAHRRSGCLNLGGGDLIWNRRGGRVPSQPRAIQVFRQLFVRGTPDEEAREMRRIQEGRSILDDVRAQVQAMNARLSD